MRPLLSIVFCFAAFFSFAQVTKIKVKKQEALYKVTLTGVDSGCASLKQIIKEKKLNVTNEKDGIKIYAYEAFVVDSNGGAMFAGKNATLTDDLIKALEKNPEKLFIRKIVAYNGFNETIQLNDIVITLVK